MTVRIVRLGSDRAPNEGLRIGTVRRPPRKEAHCHRSLLRKLLEQREASIV